MHKEPTNLDDLFERAIDRLDKLDAPVALDQAALWSRLQTNLPPQPSRKLPWLGWLAASLVLLLCAWLGLTNLPTPVATSKVTTNHTSMSLLPLVRQSTNQPSNNVHKGSSAKKVLYQTPKAATTLIQTIKNEQLSEPKIQTFVSPQEPLIEAVNTVSAENITPSEETVSVAAPPTQTTILKPKLRMVHANELAQDEPITTTPEPKASRIAVGIGFDSSPITSVEETRRFRLSLKQKLKN